MTSTPAAGRAKRMGVWPKLGLALAVLLALYGGCRVALHFKASNELNALRQVGMPTSYAELQNWQRSPAHGKKAAELFEAAYVAHEAWLHQPFQNWEKLNELPFMFWSDRWMPPPGVPLSQEILRNSKKFLADNSTVLALLHEASMLTECDFSAASYTTSPAANGACLARTLLAMEAVVATETEDTDKATDALLASMRISRMLATQAQPPDSLTHKYLDRCSVTAATWLLNRATITEAQARRLVAAMTDDHYGVSRQSGLVYYRAMALEEVRHRHIEGFPSDLTELGEQTFDAVRNPLRHFDRRFNYPTAFGMLSTLGVRDLETLHVISFFRQFEGMPLRQGVLARPAQERQMRKWGRLYAYSWEPLWDARGIHTIDAYFVARLRSTKAAVAIEGYRAVHGEIPRSPGDLVPEFLESVPVDPFTDSPLRFKRREKGYVVYSCGEGGVDHGGMVVNKSRPVEGDILIEVVR